MKYTIAERATLKGCWSVCVSVCVPNSYDLWPVMHVKKLTAMTGWKWKEINVFTGEEQAFFKVCQVILPIKAIKDKAFVIWRDHKGFHVPESLYVSVCRRVWGGKCDSFHEPKDRRNITVLLCDFKNKDPHYISPAPLWFLFAGMLAFDLRGETIRREPDLRRAVTHFGN